MQEYEHTQPGGFMRVLAGFFVTVLGVATALLLVFEGGYMAIVIGVETGIFAFLFALFHSLTVRVSRSDIELSFGVGLIQKNFSIADVQTAKIARNRWYNGWGINKIWDGWLYNVSGFDAVEIRLKNERKYRIGTDQPNKLLATVESALSESS